ncbi:hypothetical protein HGRIS_003471 [Hohenbuehelia grisea]|uniref:Uncharacterized protein n=1 Tax=Hohenbuehelia grisea TaxID=104357 RepID=A0ABR3JFW0_9AGAR
MNWVYCSAYDSNHGGRAEWYMGTGNLGALLDGENPFMTYDGDPGCSMHGAFYDS